MNLLNVEQSIFANAIEIASPEDRAKYLDEVCRNDAALRHAIESLIDAHDALKARHCTTPAGIGFRLDLFDDPARQPGPESIGPYRLLEVIGEGGMGTVWMAEQSEPVRRKVALKVIKPGMDSKQVIARFEAERQALAMMDHPNIARVFDGGTTDQGRPFFVMELVRGIPITEYCDRERLTVDERLNLFMAVCRAVQHAHQKGVIHRDLKPSNILVTVIDGAPVPKVIDFGIAKAVVGDSLTDRTLHTGIHQLLGTPLYMSPEQADLSGTDIDTRSDIYSLGVLLYELLTGATPFDAETLKHAAFDEMRRMIREDEPPRPSLRLSSLTDTRTTVADARRSEPKRLSSKLKGELDWIVMKALEKDRMRRYGTAADFADDITRFLADQPVEACPPSQSYHLRKFVKRHRGRIAASGLIGVLGLALTVALVRQSMERGARRAESAIATTQALDNAERSAQVSKWQVALAAVNQAEARLEPGGDETLRQRTLGLKRDLEMVLRLDEIRQAMSAVKDDRFDIALGDRLYAEAFRNYGIDVDTMTPSEVAARMPAGAFREEMLAALDDWMRIRRQMQKGDDTGWKRLLAAATTADTDTWRNSVRDAWLRDDRDALSKLATSAPIERLHPCDVILIQSNLGDDQAVAVLREATQRRPDDFWLNHTLGMRLHDTHPPRNDEAIGYLRTASALRPESPGAILNVGHVLIHTDRTDEAIAAFEQAIRLKPDYAMAYSNLGGALNDAGRYDDAVAACRTAIRLRPEYAAAHGNLGVALMENGELDEAIAALREAMRLEPGGSLAPRQLAIAYARKAVVSLRNIRRHIDERIMRLVNSRSVLQAVLNQGSPLMLRRHFVLNMAVTSVLASPALAQWGTKPRYVFTSFDPEGSTHTQVGGVNNANTIVGYFNDQDGVAHGFVRSGVGTFSQVDVPGAYDTLLGRINDAEDIVGRFDATSDLSHAHGFFFSGGEFATIDSPSATFTVARSINNSGQIVGKWIDAAGKSHGYLLSNGEFASIDRPKATQTEYWGINDNGQIVGQYTDAAGKTHGFLLSGGLFTTIDYPNSTETIALGINVAGQIVGRYKSKSDGGYHGFVLNRGTYTAIDHPNATFTSTVGINDFGMIVGRWVDVAGTSHGFYAVKK